MIGQEVLLDKIDKLNIMPHSILLVGDHDAGHEHIVEAISNKVHTLTIDITDDLSKDTIRQMNLQTSLTLYFVNLTKVQVRNQNILLKVLEEPSPYTYIVLYCENISSVLETIINRSYVLKMDKYSKEVLSQYAYGDNKDLALEICTTPNQVETACRTDINALIKLCDAIVNRMKTANFDNALTIADKINFSDEYDKFDLYLFYKVLSKFALEHRSVYVYDSLRKMMNSIYLMNDKKRFFEHFIIDLWRNSRK